MEKIKVNIDWVEKNYGASSNDVLGCVATAKTIEDIKKEYADTLEFHIEGCEPGELSDDLLNGNYTLEFNLSFRAMLNYYKDFVSLSAISKITGINQRQLGHYVQGIKNPRPEQQKRIIDGLRRLGQELINIA